VSPLRVKFVDDYCPFSDGTCYLYDNLRRHFDLEVTDDPDYLFYSVFGYEHSNPRYDRCVRIWHTGENIRPDFDRCDYALSCDYLEGDPRYLRLPEYVRSHGERARLLVKSTVLDAESVLASKTRFCNFLYANDRARTRARFFQLLSKYKQVDSGGTVLNNMGRVVPNNLTDKLAFLSQYKFTIAFENARYPGYTTEKLVDPMLAGSIPIYWGSPRVSEEFNPRSFINCHGYTSQQSAIEQVIKMDQDDSLYLEYLNAPWLHGNKPSPCCLPDYIIPFFQMVFADKKPRTSRPAVTITIPGHDPGWKIIL